MADDSELDYIKTLLEQITHPTAVWSDTIASVDTGDDWILMTTEHVGAVEDEFEDFHIVITLGDNAGTWYTVEQNDGNDPTKIYLVGDVVTNDLAGDTASMVANTGQLTVATFETKRRIDLIDGDRKALVYPPETMSINGYFLKKRYLVKLSVATEIIMTSIMGQIIDGFYLYNSTRTGLTSVATMCNVQVAYTGRSYVETNGRWNQDIWIDIEWRTV